MGSAVPIDNKSLLACLATTTPNVATADAAGATTTAADTFSAFATAATTNTNLAATATHFLLTTLV